MIRDGQWDWDPMGFVSRDRNPGTSERLGRTILGRLGLGQILLGQSRDKNLWDSLISSYGTSWDSSRMGFWLILLLFTSHW